MPLRLPEQNNFKALQEQIVINARALADGLQKCGLDLAYGGTDTHLLLLDLKSISVDGAVPTGMVYPVWGEPAVRIMDLAGMVANKNTIPGDLETSLATGIRLGTPWITQRGLVEKDMEILAGLIHKLLSNLKPFAYNGLIGVLPRAKVDLDLLEEVKSEVAEVAARAGIDFEVEPSGYPHHMIRDDNLNILPRKIRVSGWRARQHLNQVVTSNLLSLKNGETISTYLLDRNGNLIDEVEISREKPADASRDQFILFPSLDQTDQVLAWLRGLGDGYTLFDKEDLFRKVEGPVVVEAFEVKEGRSSSAETGIQAINLYQSNPDRFDLTKPYFIGQDSLLSKSPKSSQDQWVWKEKEAELKKTGLMKSIKKWEQN